MAGVSAVSARWLKAGFAAVAVLLAGQMVSVVPAVRAHIGHDWRGDELLSDAVYILTALLVLARAALVRRERAAWLVLGLGLSSYAAGNVYWFLVVHQMNPEPYPSLSDFLWLSLYPCLCFALLRLVHARMRHFGAAVLLDGLIAAASAAAFAWLLLPAVGIGDPGTPALTVAVSLSYPLADTVVVGCLLGAWALMGWRTERVWVALFAGIALFALADCVYMIQAANNTFVVGTWVDSAWLLALTVVATSAWSEGEATLVRGRLHAGASFALPAMLACACVALLLSGSWRNAHVPRVSGVLAAIAITAAIARMLFTVRAVQALADARRQARTDDLTGLPNRRLFVERVEEGLQGLDPRASLAVAIIDLDRFKHVNDGFGHHIGDELLQLVGTRLHDALGSHGLLARLGGDEFGLILPGADATKAAGMARDLLAALRHPFELDHTVMHVDASIGMAISPDHGTDRASLLRHADAAMYAAKAEHAGLKVATDKAPGDAGRLRLATLEELRAGLDRGELVLHYQPQIDVASGLPLGVEALVRWQHPVRGLIYPDAFLPIAEEAGLMGPITLEVLELALRQMHTWRSDGIDVTVAVNVSASNLQDVDLPAKIGEALTRHGVPPWALHLEVTEQMMIRDATRATGVLAGLRELGVRLAVDDYGTGYSSLTYLRALPVDDLKLDRAFIAHCDVDPRSAAIVASTVELAHNLGMRMIAEGVESQAIFDHLRRWGCDLAQGYHLGRPQPAERLTAVLQGHHLAVASDVDAMVGVPHTTGVDGG